MVQVLICFFKSFTECFLNCGLSFDRIKKWMTDLESAQKIGPETTQIFSEMSKIAFDSVIQINTRSVILSLDTPAETSPCEGP
jgi:hypothetical protein